MLSSESLKAKLHVLLARFYLFIYFTIIGFFILLLELVILFRSSHCQIMTQLHRNGLEEIKAVISLEF